MSGPRGIRHGAVQGIAALAVFGVVLAARDAGTQSTQGAFRLGYEGTVFATEKVTNTVKIGGVKSEAKYTETHVGLLGSALGVNLGYGVSDAVVLGVRIIQDAATIEYDDDAFPKEEASFVQFAPTLEVVLSPGSTVRPYFLGLGGIRNSTGKVDGDETSSFSALIFGGGFGLHVFPSAGVSLDPTVSVVRLSGSGKIGGIDSEGTGLAFVGSFGISAWFGGKKEERAPKEEAGNTAAMTSIDEGSPTPTSSQKPSSKNRGQLSIGLPLPKGVELRVVGRPGESGTKLSVLVTIMGGTDQYKTCRVVELEAGDHVYEVDVRGYGNRGGGFTATETLKGTVPVGALEAVSESRGEALVTICNDQREVPTAQRGRLFRFLEEFREQSEEHGTWVPRGERKKAKPAPEPEPPAASGDTDEAEEDEK